MTLQHSRHLLHHIEIEPEQPIKPRALHLEHHLPTAAQAGPVHLRQRSSSQGFRVQINDFSAALAKLLLQHSLNLGKTEGGNTVLQSGKLGHPASGQDVRPGRKQLPELDEGRPQPQQFCGQPVGSLALALFPQLRIGTARIGPGLGVPPEQQQQGEHRTPDAQRTQQPRHQERTSSERLISATEALNRSITACGVWSTGGDSGSETVTSDAASAGSACPSSRSRRSASARTSSWNRSHSCRSRSGASCASTAISAAASARPWPMRAPRRLMVARMKASEDPMDFTAIKENSGRSALGSGGGRQRCLRNNRQKEVVGELWLKRWLSVQQRTWHRFRERCLHQHQW